jgi:hypothetical protein
MQTQQPEQPAAPNLPGRATRPSSETPIINTSFLIARPFHPEI